MYTRIVHLMPQNFPRPEFIKVCTGLFPKKRSMIFSADDAARLVTLPDSAEDSRIVVHGNWEADIEAWLRERGVTNIEFIDPSPLSTKSWFWVDMSQYVDGEVDWAKLSQICEGVILKATQGKSDVDDFFVHRLEMATLHGLKVEVYHYVDRSGTPKEQGEHLYNVIHPYRNQIETVWIDAEWRRISEDGANTVLDILSVDELIGIRDTVKDKLPRMKMGWYTAGYWLDECQKFHEGEQGNIRRLDDSTMAWWLAGYINRDGAWGADENGLPIRPSNSFSPLLSPFIPEWLTRYDLWQFAEYGVVPGVPSNRINYNLRNKFNHNAPVQPDPVPLPEPTPIPPPEPTLVPTPAPTAIPDPPRAPIPPLQSGFVRHGVSVSPYGRDSVYKQWLPLYQQISPNLIRLRINPSAAEVDAVKQDFPNAVHVLPLVVSSTAKLPRNFRTVAGRFESENLIIELIPQTESGSKDWNNTAIKAACMDLIKLIREKGFLFPVAVRSEFRGQEFEIARSLWLSEDSQAIVLEVGEVNAATDIAQFTSDHPSIPVIPHIVSHSDERVFSGQDIGGKYNRILAQFQGDSSTRIYGLLFGRDCSYWIPATLRGYSYRNRKVGVNIGHTEELTPIEAKTEGVTDKLLQAYDVVRWMEAQQINDSTAGTVAQYTQYDNGEWITSGGPWSEQYRMPIAEIIKYSIRTQTRPWLCVPHRANTELMSYIVETTLQGLPSYLRPIFEYSNEIWNGFFKQGQYAEDKWWDSSTPVWQRKYFYQAHQTKLLSQIVNGRGDIVISGQATEPNYSRLFIDQLGVGDYVDALAIGPYFGRSIRLNQKDDKLESMLSSDISGRVRNLCIQHKQIADRGGVDLYAYEAGQHIEGRTPLEVECFRAINRSHTMLRLHQQFEAMWHEIGGGLLCWFSLYSKYDNKFYGLSEITGKAPYIQLLPKTFSFTP